MANPELGNYRCNPARDGDSSQGHVAEGLETPYSRKGELWEDYRRYYAKDDAATLVWKADTLKHESERAAIIHR